MVVDHSFSLDNDGGNFSISLWGRFLQIGEYMHMDRMVGEGGFRFGVLIGTVAFWSRSVLWIVVWVLAKIESRL